MGGDEKQNLSEEDQKLLDEAKANRDNPDHPAHKDHPDHKHYVGDLVKRFGHSVIFGAGATVGSNIVNGIFH
uniref:Uncharacterized protein n=1 Tax=Bionectria ochroleuca TaxID=29856 RepID=A0A8H7N8Y1_BIOOC